MLWGVSGCGKSTVGALLGETLGWRFFDADDFHPQANIDKMRAGIALTDADRAPWLAILADEMQQLSAQGENAILACSALKQAYRDRLEQDSGQVTFVHLAGSFEMIAARLRNRSHEFMNDSLLTSQFATLEVNEGGVTIDIGDSLSEIVAKIRAELGI